MKALPGRTYSVTSACPNAMILAQYASGMLTEIVATGVSEHVDSCSRCQSVVDDMSRRNDSLLDAMRHRVEGPPQSPTLERLIVDAQRLVDPGANDPAPSGSTAKASSSDEPVAIDEFVGCLRKSRLLNDSELELLVEQYEPTSSETFSKQLISRNKLTQFQARALRKGRWKGLVLGNYSVLEKLGEGGMGYVFKARHRRLGNIACIKVLQAAGRKSPEVLERFRREARTIARLDHPNIVVAHDAGETEGIPFLAMEYIDGSDLSRLVNERGRLSVSTATDIILQVARALAYAHRQGIVHRDIKPHNLMMPLPKESPTDSGVESADSSVGTIKLLDLGLARFDRYLAEDPDSMTAASMTSTGVIMGTVDYMSPEQALNGRNADSRSDIYSLGCTMFFLLTGRVMFGGETLMEKLVAHRENESPSLRDDDPDIPMALDAIFQKTVRKDADERYQSVDELVNDLEAFVDGRAVDVVEHATPLQREGVNLRKFVARQKRAARRMSVSLAVLLVVGLWSSASWWTPYVWSTSRVTLASSEPHPHTVAAGGDGRILVVVPHQRYDDLAFFRLVEAGRQRGIELVTVTSGDEPALPMTELDYQINPDITLEQVRAQDFDAIVFCSGSVQEFKHSGTEAGRETRRIIREALSGTCVLAGIDSDRGDGDGLDVIYTVMKEFGESPQFTQIAQGLAADLTPQHSRQVVIAQSHKATRQLMSFVFDDVLLPGHPDTKANGGPGRVLLAVSQHGYDSIQLRTLKKELDRHGFQYQTASGIVGDLENSDGTHETIDLRLDEVRVTDFDAIVFCGGGDCMHEFGKGQFHPDTRRLVVGMLDQGRVVAAIENGRVALERSVGLSSAPFKTASDGVNIAPAKDRDGLIVVAAKCERAADMLTVVLNRL